MKKQKEDVFVSIPVKDIVSESNRKIGGMGNIDILAEDIKQNGLTNPPTVVETEDGKYQVVAGRRRIEAVRQLKWKEVTVKLISGNEERLVSIALSENVNRMEMHPLDEAEYFKKLLDNGTDINEIAATFDRTIAGIQHRIRLCDLIEGIKAMFREEKIPLTGAALLASLPAEDQEKFLKKYGEKKVEKYEVSSFIHSVQHCPLGDIADKECAKCKKRTNNTIPGLFDDDFAYLEDVCFDEECYGKKWRALIAGLITKHDDFDKTDFNIILDSSIPKFLPKKTETINLGESSFTVLPTGKYTWNETKKKAKSKTAWVVEKKYQAKEISVKGVAYEEYKKPNYNSYQAPSNPVQEYLIDQVLDIPPESQKAVAAKVKEKYPWAGDLKRVIKGKLIMALISKRLQEESRENLVAIFIRDLCEGTDDDGNILDFEDEEEQKIFNVLFGSDGITKFEEIPQEPLAEKLIMFIIATGIRMNDLPDIDSPEHRWETIEKSLKWKFLQVTKEEYIGMYRELLSAAIKEVQGEEPAQEETPPDEPSEDESEPEIDMGEDPPEESEGENADEE
ncbi:hypothetical protein FACS189468_5660 [Spirochaetia bacterium]|nr:hypothetical protein FACS189468_5660 [Spirochaetia bacterium]